MVANRTTIAVSLVVLVPLAALFLTAPWGDDAGPPPAPTPPAEGPDSPGSGAPGVAGDSGITEPPSLPDSTLVGGPELPGGADTGAGRGEGEQNGEGEEDLDPVPEPDGWRDLEKELREDADPVEVRLRKDLSDSRLFVDFRSTPLMTAARYVEDQTGIRVRVDNRTWEEYTQAEVAVTIEAGTMSVAEVLDGFLKGGRLAWWVEGDAVKLGPRPPRPKYVEHLFPLGGLTKHFEPDAVADLVRETLDPEVWDDGGDVSVDHDRGALRVKAPRSTHRKILALLRKLAGGGR